MVNRPAFGEGRVQMPKLLVLFFAQLVGQFLFCGTLWSTQAAERGAQFVRTVKLDDLNINVRGSDDVVRLRSRIVESLIKVVERDAMITSFEKSFENPVKPEEVAGQLRAAGAANALGEYRAVDAIPCLVKKIDFALWFGPSLAKPRAPGQWEEVEPELPSVDALVKIGLPSVPAVIKLGKNTDDRFRVSCCARVLVGVLGPVEATEVLVSETRRTDSEKEKLRLKEFLKHVEELGSNKTEANKDVPDKSAP